MRMKKCLEIINAVLGGLLIACGALVLEALQYKEAIFGEVTFEQIWFSVTGNMQGANMGVFSSFYKWNIPLTLLGAAVLTGLLYLLFHRLNRMKGIRIVHQLYALLGLLVFGCCSFYALKSIGALHYVKTLMAEKSNVYEEHYVDPNSVKVTFPEKKRNLVYIFCESMENTYMVNSVGGAQDISFIPNLTQLMADNTFFYNPETHNGAQVEYGCDWTAAAMLAQSSGIPMCLPNGQNDYENYTTFLPGLTNLGDILSAKGYHCEAMMGSDAAFGGRKAMFTTHGNYDIFDLSTAIKKGYIDPDYFVWWGFEDRKLFSYAKTELTQLAAQDQPFALTMLTADTHFTEGYVDAEGGTYFKDHYQNSLANSDILITDFVKWLQQQDFYENTTVVISGDHLNMGGAYISQLDPDYPRTVFSTILNPAVEYTGKRDHAYCTMDLFPTTLAAMGCTIEGNRLGFGTNLFSDQDTLIEELGYQELYDQLSRPSAYYESHFVVSRKRASAFR